jgi:transposase
MRRVFDREFKLSLVRALESGEKRLAQVCREHSLSQGMVCRWREVYRDKGFEAFLGTGQSSDSHGSGSAEDRIAALESALGRAHMEIDFLQRALAKKGSPAVIKSR